MFRKTPSGDLFAPHRGKPPPCPEGYIQDRGDPFIYHPVVNDCKYRDRKLVPCNCGTPSYKLWCTRYDKKTNLGICKECQDAES